MLVGGLPLPQELLDALETDRWPRSAKEAMKQNLHSLVPEQRLRVLAPDESRIYLYPPPFYTVASALERSEDTFYHRFAALDQIVPEAAIEIGDFGIGSDSLIILDYRASATDPRVLRLCWPRNGRPNYWEIMSPDFPGFIKALGL